MALPGQPSATIASLTNRVIAALQNRSDVSEKNQNPEMRPSAWIRDAIRELTESNVFEELRVVGPSISLSIPTTPAAGTQPPPVYPRSTYPISMFLNPGDDYTMFEDPNIFIDYPTNSIAYPMTYMTPKAIQPLLNIPGGVPFMYSRYGNAFWFGVQAGQPFTVFLPYQKRHPFQPDNLPTSIVYMPESWHDVIGYAGAHRGAVALRWNDQVDFLHKLLYGDPTAAKDSGTAIGLIKQRLLQMDRDMSKSSRQIMPRIERS